MILLWARPTTLATSQLNGLFVTLDHSRITLLHVRAQFLDIHREELAIFHHYFAVYNRASYVTSDHILGKSNCRIQLVNWS